MAAIAIGVVFMSCISYVPVRWFLIYTLEKK